ncbi:ubiquinone biosynthesis protein COQ4 homolog 2, mitochondrial-like isoform X5 [Mercenaria mercenaria]|uniref:ubiquinone biosynthesis protein COQ4 homolog 2, mitochondrial-like isoform X5 n=1 Tax=Mercenaria mercenaria TaxID=6596 RepID=UPI00234E4F35|nr:ubiquinone biosynthesis protein COQ4 homolog 2, mitochondrial-like isoform X5 [Mercenaria mercenaria]
MRTGISYTKYSKLKELLKLFNTRNATLKRTLASTTKTADDSISQEEEGSEFASDREKYRGHRPTSMFQKVLLTTGSALMSLYDPSRGDMIATLGDVTADSALKYIKQKMEGDSVGQQILLEQPVINTQTVSIDYLGSLPENTFGKEYWRFLSKHGFSPDARLPVHYVDDPELVYVMLRYRQCHDLFHTILGMKPNMLGEVAVKWVEAIQTGLPMCSLVTDRSIFQHIYPGQFGMDAMGRC